MPIRKNYPNTDTNILRGNINVEPYNIDKFDGFERPEDYYPAYLLRDIFSTPLVAGTVNGTAAEPGPGTRTVADTNSKLSIAGGVLDFATGGAGAGDPGLWYGAVTRVLGRVLHVNFSYTTSQVWIGFANTASGTVNLSRILIGGNIQISGVITVGNASAGTTYQVVIITRAIGAFFFIKGGAFTNWTFLYADIGNATANILPTIQGITAGTSVFTADNIRVPARLFIPAPLASDGFSLAGQTDGAGHAEANGGAGLAWTGATWTVAAGAVTNAPTQGAEELTDPGLEGTYTAGLNANLTKTGTPTVAESADVHGGSKAQEFTATANQDRLTQSVVVTDETWHIATLWAKRTAGAAGTVKLVVNAGVSTIVGPALSDAAYTQKVMTFRSETVSNSFIPVYQIGGTPFDTIIVDDISLTPLTLSSLFRSLVVSTADVVADVAVTLTAGTQAGLVVNLDSAASPANFIIIYIDGTNCKADECVAGVYTSKISAAVTYVAGAVLRVVRDGTALRVFYNNIAVGSLQTMSSNTGTLHGLFSTYSGNSLDNLVIWARGTGGEWSALDAF